MGRLSVLSTIALAFALAYGSAAEARGRARRSNAPGISPAARAAVQRVVRNPRRVSARDKNLIKPLKPQQRAQLLSELAGFRLEPVRFARASWMRLYLPDSSNARDVYSAVMGPNQINYIARSHSRVMWEGKVYDIWGGMTTSRIRHGSGGVKLTPIWLDQKQAKRYDGFIKYLKRNATDDAGWAAVLGEAVGFGRCSAWPLRSLNQRTSSNSCTTPVHRAPVGDRKPEFAWMDQLAAKVKNNAAAKRAVGNKPLLAALTGKSKSALRRIFSRLERALPGERAKIDNLKKWAEKYQELGLKKFPLDWHGRYTLAEVLGVTGDHPGPSGTLTKIRGRDPRQVDALGVDVKFER